MIYLKKQSEVKTFYILILENLGKSFNTLFNYELSQYAIFFSIVSIYHNLNQSTVIIINGRGSNEKEGMKLN